MGLEVFLSDEKLLLISTQKKAEDRYNQVALIA
jgi:hypothetical protein